MTLQSTKICEGITLSHINTDKFKVSSLTLTVSIPATKRSALLGLLLCGVMHRGTEKHPSFSALNRHLSMLYGTDMNVSCTRHAGLLTFTVDADMLEQRYSLDSTDILGAVTDTAAEILLRPKKCGGMFPEDTVASEKDILRDTLCAEKNNSGAYAMLRLKELMSRDRETPTLEYMLSELDGITSAELSEFHDSLLSRPISVMYVGSESAEAVKERLLNAFSPLQGTADTAPTLLTPSSPLAFLRGSEDKAAAQTRLAMGLRTGVCLGEAEYPAAQLLNEIFGASPASKLFLGVRERLGLCYSCYSSYNSLAGNMYVGAGIDKKNAELAEREILASLDEIREGKISDAEFYAAQKSLGFYYTQLYDSPHSLARFYRIRSLFGVNSTPESELSAIKQTTREQVSSLALRIKYDTAFTLYGTQNSEILCDD